MARAPGVRIGPYEIAAQFVGRLTGLPLDQPDGPGLLHLVLAARYSNVNAG